MDPNTRSGLALAGLFALAACADAGEAMSNVDGPALADGNHPATVGDSGAGSWGENPGPLGSDGASNSCARATISIKRITPTVQVVVDASGSMIEPLGDCGRRWDCLREALIGEGGLITELQRTVSFGLTLYGGQIAKVEDGQVTELLNPTCPRIVHVEPALDNRDVIASRYEIANPGGGTPTAEALQRVVDALPDPLAQIDTPLGPQIILLVTDGDPNVCADPVTTQYAPTEAQALRAQEKNIQLYALTVADDQNRTHLKRMANLGAGLTADAVPGAPYFEPSGADALSQLLRRIVGGAVGCEVQLKGTVTVSQPGDECEGAVSLNGTPLECNGTDGWRLSGESTLVLQGEACERFKFDPSVTLSADFPCELVVVL